MTQDRNDTPDLAGLLHDRPADGLFRVDRSAYTSRAVFELEQARIFESTWVFVGLESQVARPYDYLTTTLGRQPVLLTRDGDGRLHCLLNSCRHRGALVALEPAGNKRVHVCQYHGWAYEPSGRCAFLPGKEDGRYPPAFDASSDHGLVPVPRFAGYRGLLFASLSTDVPDLEAHLGDARRFIDLVMDQAPDGFETVPGAIAYTFNANWKLQLENGLDYYHFSSTHASYMDVIRNRGGEGANPPAPERWFPDDTMDQGTFGFDRGHAVMWGNRNSLRVTRPLRADPRLFDRVSGSTDPLRLKWMHLNRNLTIFPNLQIIDVHSLQLRVWQPLAPDRTLMRSWCLAPVGEAAAARRDRIRQYEDFFNPSGMATSDDNTMFELSQRGLAATAAGVTEGHLRGLGPAPASPRLDPWQLARDLGVRPTDAQAGGMAFGGETVMHACYREWHRLLTQPPGDVQ
ncbi:SRPBCC family protein [Aquabacterium sp. J223]|uniref:aromatic ring-hydroxylating oxygenase subunit alpha n=1 Tax=Aquabacterium sp. J223 TaxID=2898431 RepID=UPI0021AE002D|nr:SRPBCC family protein [Aquabacterium sp. J223]UUX94973.1 Rieske 2Fe-2S domain-containing protein [Aquabacterium sp. J223]